MPGLVLQLQLRAGLQWHLRREGAARHFHEGFRIDLAVAILRGHRNLLALSDLHVVDLVLQTGDDVPHALDELQRLALLRRVDHRAIDVERVVHRHHLAVVDFGFLVHELSNLSCRGTAKGGIVTGSVDKGLGA